VGILLGLLSAVAYGSSDFAAGLGSRRLAFGPVTAIVQGFGVAAAGIAVLLFPGTGPAAGPLLWGTVSGIGSGLGSLALYRGLTLGAMSVTATCSAVLTAVLPAIIGLALGESLSLPAAIGIGIAIPAVALVSWQPHPGGGQRRRAGLGYGIAAGAGFALLFIALARAGTTTGAWPLLPGQGLSLLIVLPFARGIRRPRSEWRPAALPVIAAGLLSGLANLLFLAAAGHGRLAVVAVLTSLYPAVTVLLARVVLTERWSRLQAAGLLTAATAITLVSIG
jgi:drug/metabolite transporter (DMT)-like permease